MTQAEGRPGEGLFEMLDGLEEPMYLAPTLTPPTKSCPARWDGCSRDSTTPDGPTRSMPCYRTLQAHHTERGVAFGSAAWLIAVTRT